MIRFAVALMFTVSCGSSSAVAPPPSAAEVVFVCDHGSAKSVVAAAVFNDVARRRGLTLRANARGIVPDEAIAPVVVRGLAADGLVASAPTPSAFSDHDHAAVRVIYLGDGDPSLGPRGEKWIGIPPVSKNYATSRDAMQARIATLLDELAARR